MKPGDTLDLVRGEVPGLDALLAQIERLGTSRLEIVLKAPKGKTAEGPPAQLRSRDERLAAGKAPREALPRAHHATWKPPANRPDPIDVLVDSNRDRVPELVPIRHGRMLRSPFTFLRASAGLRKRPTPR